jgi:hypothetical protein
MDFSDILFLKYFNAAPEGMAIRQKSSLHLNGKLEALET